MAKSEGERLTDEKIAKGGVLAKLYFDMQSKQKEQLQPLLADLINQRLLKEKGVVYCFGVIDEPMEKGGVFTTNAVLTVLFDSFFPLVSVAFNYAPAGIELLKPQGEMKFSTAQLQTMLMDLSGISMIYSKFILERVMKPEELGEIQKAVKEREELGRKFTEAKKEKPEK